MMGAQNQVCHLIALVPVHCFLFTFKGFHRLSFRKSIKIYSWRMSYSRKRGWCSPDWEIFGCFKLSLEIIVLNAEYSISMCRQTQLRKPNNLPDKDELCKLREFTVIKIRGLSDDAFAFMTQNEFPLLQDLVVYRLTLFNDRRGGEPSCLVLSEWKDVDNK